MRTISTLAAMLGSMTKIALVKRQGGFTTIEWIILGLIILIMMIASKRPVNTVLTSAAAGYLSPHRFQAMRSSALFAAWRSNLFGSKSSPAHSMNS